MKKTNNSKKIILIVSISLTVFLIISAIVGLVYFIYDWYIKNPKYVTTDIADYGEYIGTNDDETADDIINSFFPMEIQENFANVEYSYKGCHYDGCAFEAYLEFTIEDPEDYAEFVSEYTEGIDGVTSPYDDTYTEYVIKDRFRLVYSDDEIADDMVHDEEGREDTYAIEYADVRKIICCPDEQRIIFVAIVVYDGGGTDAEFLCTYFNRFDINPREYARVRDLVGDKIETPITNQGNQSD